MERKYCQHIQERWRIPLQRRRQADVCCWNSLILTAQRLTKEPTILLQSVKRDRDLQRSIHVTLSDFPEWPEHSDVKQGSIVYFEPHVISPFFLNEDCSLVLASSSRDHRVPGTQQKVLCYFMQHLLISSSLLCCNFISHLFIQGSLATIPLQNRKGKLRHTYTYALEHQSRDETLAQKPTLKAVM